MKIYKSYKNLAAADKQHIIAIGNFDGVHRGHQVLLQTARDLAQKMGKKFGVLTFEPHPTRLFRPDDPPSRLTPAPVKIWRLEECGVESLYSIPFDWDFASQSYQDFITNVLKDGLEAAHVVIGHDFCFGQLRKGEPAHIKEAGIPTTIVEKIEDETGEAFSSSRARQFLRHGDIAAANSILGWEWEIRGEVIKGDQRGRELGYPTANMKLGDTVHPAYGVYAGLVQIEGENEWHKSAINIGIRPMFEIAEAQVESYIFDFDRDIYGKTLRVKPVKRLRGEAKFNSLGDLIRQMQLDCENARDILE